MRLSIKRALSENVILKFSKLQMYSPVFWDPKEVHRCLQSGLGSMVWNIDRRWHLVKGDFFNLVVGYEPKCEV